MKFRRKKTYDKNQWYSAQQWFSWEQFYWLSSLYKIYTIGVCLYQNNHVCYIKIMMRISHFLKTCFKFGNQVKIKIWISHKYLINLALLHITRMIVFERNVQLLIGYWLRSFWWWKINQATLESVWLTCSACIGSTSYVCVYRCREEGEMKNISWRNEG